jgi:putative sterol carrier protein
VKPSPGIRIMDGSGYRDYHDIVTGKLDGVTAVVTGKMKIEGDVGFMAQLREMMKPL